MLHDKKEQVAKMKQIKLIGLALLAVFALSVVAASVAQAEEAPFWSIEGTRLAAGKTHFITTKIYKEGEEGQTLKLETPAAGVVVTCTGLNFPFETGVILGSEAETPGTNNEVAHFTGCTVTGNGTKCGVEGKEVTTNPIKSELVENVESSKAGKTLLVEFSPFTGSTFVTLKFKAETGGKCTFTTTPVEGSAAAEVLNENGEAVKLPNELKEFNSGLTRFPTTEIKEVWLVKAGTGSAVSVGLKAFGLLASREVGTALVLLAKVTGTTLESEERKWSALP
jgi:opacity protein-like surface antigen